MPGRSVGSFWILWYSMVLCAVLLQFADSNGAFHGTALLSLRARFVATTYATTSQGRRGTRRRQRRRLRHYWQLRRFRARRRWCRFLNARCYSAAENRVLLQRGCVEPNPGPPRHAREPPAPPDRSAQADDQPVAAGFLRTRSRSPEPPRRAFQPGSANAGGRSRVAHSPQSAAVSAASGGAPRAPENVRGRRRFARSVPAGRPWGTVPAGRVQIAEAAREASPAQPSPEFKALTRHPNKALEGFVRGRTPENNSSGTDQTSGARAFTHTRGRSPQPAAVSAAWWRGAPRAPENVRGRSPFEPDAGRPCARTERRARIAEASREASPAQPSPEFKALTRDPNKALRHFLDLVDYSGILDPTLSDEDMARLLRANTPSMDSLVRISKAVKGGKLRFCAMCDTFILPADEGAETFPFAGSKLYGSGELVYDSDVEPDNIDRCRRTLAKVNGVWYHMSQRGLFQDEHGNTHVTACHRCKAAATAGKLDKHFVRCLDFGMVPWRLHGVTKAEEMVCAPSRRYGGLVVIRVFSHSESQWGLRGHIASMPHDAPMAVATQLPHVDPEMFTVYFVGSQGNVERAKRAYAMACSAEQPETPRWQEMRPLIVRTEVVMQILGFLRMYHPDYSHLPPFTRERVEAAAKSVSDAVMNATVWKNKPGFEIGSESAPGIDKAGDDRNPWTSSHRLDDDAPDGKPRMTADGVLHVIDPTGLKLKDMRAELLQEEKRRKGNAQAIPAGNPWDLESDSDDSGFYDCASNDSDSVHIVDDHRLPPEAYLDSDDDDAALLLARNRDNDDDAYHLSHLPSAAHHDRDSDDDDGEDAVLLNHGDVAPAAAPRAEVPGHDVEVPFIDNMPEVLGGENAQALVESYLDEAKNDGSELDAHLVELLLVAISGQLMPTPARTLFIGPIAFSNCFNDGRPAAERLNTLMCREFERVVAIVYFATPRSHRENHFAAFEYDPQRRMLTVRDSARPRPNEGEDETKRGFLERYREIGARFAEAYGHQPHAVNISLEECQDQRINECGICALRNAVHLATGQSWNNFDRASVSRLHAERAFTLQLLKLKLEYFYRLAAPLGVQPMPAPRGVQAMPAPTVDPAVSASDHQVHTEDGKPAAFAFSRCTDRNFEHERDFLSIFSRCYPCALPFGVYVDPQFDRDKYDLRRVCELMMRKSTAVFAEHAIWMGHACDMQRRRAVNINTHRLKVETTRLHQLLSALENEELIRDFLRAYASNDPKGTAKVVMLFTALLKPIRATKGIGVLTQGAALSGMAGTDQLFGSSTMMFTASLDDDNSPLIKLLHTTRTRDTADGHEADADEFTSSHPALCGGLGSLAFYNQVTATANECLGCPLDFGLRKVNPFIKSGMLGRILAWSLCVETQERGTLHFHARVYLLVPPSLMSRIMTHPMYNESKKALVEFMDRITTTNLDPSTVNLTLYANEVSEVMRELHRSDSEKYPEDQVVAPEGIPAFFTKLWNDVCAVSERRERQSYWTPMEREVLARPFRDEWLQTALRDDDDELYVEKFRWFAYVAMLRTQIHRHSRTCEKNVQPAPDGTMPCRMAMPKAISGSTYASELVLSRRPEDNEHPTILRLAVNDQEIDVRATDAMRNSGFNNFQEWLRTARTHPVKNADSAGRVKAQAAATLQDQARKGVDPAGLTAPQRAAAEAAAQLHFSDSLVGTECLGHIPPDPKLNPFAATHHAHDLQGAPVMTWVWKRECGHFVAGNMCYAAIWGSNHNVEIVDLSTSAVMYMIKYTVKTQMTDRTFTNAAYYIIMFREKRPDDRSTAPDGNSDVGHSLFMLRKFLNFANAKCQEVSQQACGWQLLRGDSFMTSHQTRFLFLNSALRFAVCGEDHWRDPRYKNIAALQEKIDAVMTLHNQKREFDDPGVGDYDGIPLLSSSDDDADGDHDHSAATDIGLDAGGEEPNTVAEEGVVDMEERVPVARNDETGVMQPTSVEQVVNYAYRPKGYIPLPGGDGDTFSFARLSLRKFVAMFEDTPLPSEHSEPLVPDDPRPERYRDGRKSVLFAYHPQHPLYRKRCLRLMAKQFVPTLAGTRPRAGEASTDKLVRRALAIASVCDIPWAFDQPINTDPVAWINNPPADEEGRRLHYVSVHFIKNMFGVFRVSSVSRRMLARARREHADTLPPRHTAGQADGARRGGNIDPGFAAGDATNNVEDHMTVDQMKALTDKVLEQHKSDNPRNKQVSDVCDAVIAAFGESLSSARPSVSGAQRLQAPAEVVQLVDDRLRARVEHQRASAEQLRAERDDVGAAREPANEPTSIAEGTHGVTQPLDATQDTTSANQTCPWAAANLTDEQQLAQYRALDAEQRIISQRIFDATRSKMECKKSGLPRKPLRLAVIGPPGTGKTTGIKTSASLERALGPDAPPLTLLATTGTAAVNLGGETYHSFVGYAMKSTPGATQDTPFRGSSNLGAQKRVQHAGVIVIDEVSMLGKDEGLPKLLQQLQRLTKNYPKPGQKDFDPWCGLDVVLVGDPFQLPPVGDGSLFDVKFWNTPEMSAFEVLTLTQQHRVLPTERCAAHARQIEFLRSLPKHTLGDVMKHVTKLRPQDRWSIIDDEGSIILTKLNTTRFRLNREALRQFARINETFVLEWRRPLSSTTVLFDPRADAMLSDLPVRHDFFAYGARCMLTTNTAVQFGLVNGATGYYHSIAWESDTEFNTARQRVVQFLSGDFGINDDDPVARFIPVPPPTHIFVSMPVSNPRAFEFFERDPDRDNHVIVAQSLRSNSKLPIVTRPRRKKGGPMPLLANVIPHVCTHNVEPAYAITYNKVQGQTIRGRVVLVLDANLIGLPDLYVGLTRATDPDNIRYLTVHTSTQKPKEWPESVFEWAKKYIVKK